MALGTGQAGVEDSDVELIGNWLRVAGQQTFADLALGEAHAVERHRPFVGLLSFRIAT